MTSLTSSSIEVTPEDFKRVNAALIRLLLTLYECGGSLPTRRLYESAHMSRTYGNKVIHKAEQQGYITRVKVPKPQGKRGNHMMVNKLTLKAKILLKQLDLT